MGGSLVEPSVVLPPGSDIDKLPAVLNALLAAGGHPRPERTAAPCAELEDLLKWNADGLTEVATFHRDVREHRRQIDGKLTSAVERLRNHPYGVVALVAFLHSTCDSVWEVSYHYEPMWFALRRLRTLWQDHQPWHDDRERRIGEALLTLVDNLYCEIHAENAMTCGFVDRAADYFTQAHHHAIRAYLDASQVLDELDPGDDLAPPDRAARCYGEYVVDWTASSRHYDSGAADAARGIARFLSGQGGLDETLRAVRDAEQSLLDIYDPNTPYPADIGSGQDWSEIRAYRHDIDALIEAQHQPWLFIDDGTITYIYPFALRLPDPVPGPPRSTLMARYQAFVDRLADLTSPDEATRETEVARQDRVLDELSRLRVGGVPVTRVRRRFVLDDVWHGTDVSGRRFDGFVLELPTVTLHVPTTNPDDPDVAAGEVVMRLAAEIRLSHLGNHYLKFTGRLRNVGPHDLHIALLRAAPEHGAMVVTFDPSAEDDPLAGANGQPVAASANDATSATGASDATGAYDQAVPVWPQLSALAMAVIEDVCHGMGAERTASEGSFQVLLTITAASAASAAPAPGPGTPAARRALADVDALRAAYGSAVLFNPVPHMVTSFAEWSHYVIPDGAEVSNPWGRRGRTTIRTANTTVHIALGAPQWELTTTCTISEFVASLAGLFGRWMEQLNRHAEELNRHRDELETVMETTDTEALERLRQAADLLRTKRLDLQTFVTQCRSMIAFIKSPALVRSPTVAAQMARMLDAGGFHLLEQEFNRRAEQVLSNDLQAVIDKAATDMEERTERRHRRNLDTILAVIAAIGVSGLAQLIQAGYGFGGEISLAFAVAICILAAIVGTTVAARYRVTRPRPVKDRVARHGNRRVGRQADPARGTVGGMGVGPRRAAAMVDAEVLAPAGAPAPEDS
jgi:hypothetical protein